MPPIAFAIAALAGLAYLGGHTRFMADDFCSAYYAQRFGLLRSIWYWYRTWSGRYTAFAFDWLSLEAFGRYGAWLFPPLTLGFWLVAAVGTIHTALRRAAPQSKNLAAALALGSLFLVTVILLSPDVPQSFYWLNGLRAYVLPLGILTFYAWLFAWGAPKLKSSRAVRWGCGMAFCLTFVNGGLSETYAAMQIALLIVLVSLQWLAGNRKGTAALFLLMAALLGALAALIVIVLAPGNAIRQSYFPSPPAPLKLLTISMQAYLNDLSEIITSLQKISALLGALLASLWIGGRYRGRFRVQGWLIVALALAGIVLSFAGFLPGVYGYSEAPPPRTLSIATFALVAFWLCSTFLAGGWLAQGAQLFSRARDALLALAIALTGVACTLTIQSVHRQRQTYVAFAQLWDRADAQILQARAQGQAEVHIPALENWAGLDRPSDNPKFWATVCYSKYYGIQVYGPPYP